MQVLFPVEIELTVLGEVNVYKNVSVPCTFRSMLCKINWTMLSENWLSRDQLSGMLADGMQFRIKCHEPIID